VWDRKTIKFPFPFSFSLHGTPPGKKKRRREDPGIACHPEVKKEKGQHAASEHSCGRRNFLFSFFS
jgi:hypothetical protein